MQLTITTNANGFAITVKNGEETLLGSVLLDDENVHVIDIKEIELSEALPQDAYRIIEEIADQLSDLLELL